MYSRIIPGRLDRRSSARRAAAVVPFTGDFGAYLDSLAGAGTTVFYSRGDLGLVTTGAIVNAWQNQIVGGGAWGHVIELGAGVGIGSISAGVGGKAGVVGNGTTQSGAIATIPLPLAAPATTELHVYAVANITVGVAGTDQPFITTNSANYGIYKGNGTANTLHTFCGALRSTTLVSGTWGRIRKSFTGTASDVLKWGNAVAVTGTTGNGIGQLGMGVFSYPNGALPSPWDCALLMFSRAPLASFEAAMPAMDAAVTAFFGGSVSV